MTKSQFLRKLRSLTPETRKMLLRECEHLFDCGGGGVDIDDFEDNALPKMILSVGMEMEKIAGEWRPQAGDYRAVARHLRHF